MKIKREMGFEPMPSSLGTWQYSRASRQNKALADGQAASSVSTLYKDDIAVTCHFPAGQFNHSAQGVAKWTAVFPLFQHRSEETPMRGSPGPSSRAGVAIR